MTQSLNKPFTLHLSNVRGRKTNTSYPYEAPITCPADLMKAAKFDHTAVLFKDGKNSKGGMIAAHRAIKDFVEEDCVITDCDNKENNPMLPDIPPEEWKTPEDVHKAFPGVEFIAIPSRNHMKEKNGLPARPKHHYYFPRSRKAETAGESAKLRNAIIEHFPQFDEKAKDPAHFMFGIESPLEPIYYPGEICIDEFMQQLEQRVNDEAAVIPDGCRNATLSRYAFSMLKRFGMDDGTAESLFYQKAGHCEPPLDDSELSTIWNSAVSGYKEKVLSNPDYVDPATFAAQMDFAAAGGKKKVLTSADIERILAELGVTVRLNVISGAVDIQGLPSEFSTTNAPNVLPVYLTDYIKRHHMKCSKQDLDDCLVLIEDKNRFNPFEEMLTANPWDGTDRLAELPEILDIDADGIEFNTYVIKWLWQTVSLALNDDDNPAGADGVLTLQGNQGIGKTRFFAVIALKADWFSEGVSINTDNKDTIIQATGSLIAELGELDSTLKREQSALKAFLTAARDMYRLPYARAAVRRPRRTSFCATVNPEEFLNDETGSRRFWTVHVGNIDVERLNSLSKEWVTQLWAQVYEQYYKTDPQGFRLSREERATLEKSNERYSKPIAGEIEIMDALDWEQPVSKWKWYRTSELKDALRLYRITPAQIGKALTRISTRDLRIETKAPGNVKQYLLPGLLPETSRAGYVPPL